MVRYHQAWLQATRCWDKESFILETVSEDDSFLIFSDTYYPGWRAYIDNVETKIYRTNGIIKGIYISKGEHTVLFKYVPSYFWIGAIISLSTFILVVVCIVVLFIKRKKNINKISSVYC
ncbi:MAG: hypothetical protein A2Z35_06325 [Actinobacteria bacterium RBG_19FT_COMBO_36_27]|nr:MAG: hypothetical protein A2Z35_06325 [Actinobacteria bacterium RBG_19FT_COMBO_36_27]